VLADLAMHFTVRYTYMPIASKSVPWDHSGIPTARELLSQASFHPAAKAGLNGSPPGLLEFLHHAEPVDASDTSGHR